MVDGQNGAGRFFRGQRAKRRQTLNVALRGLTPRILTRVAKNAALGSAALNFCRPALPPKLGERGAFPVDGEHYPRPQGQEHPTIVPHMTTRSYQLPHVSPVLGPQISNFGLHQGT